MEVYKPLSFLDLLKQAETMGTQRVHARYDAVLLPFTSVAKSPGCPVISAPKICFFCFVRRLGKQTSGSYQACCSACRPRNVWPRSQCYLIQASNNRRQVDHILLGVVAKLQGLLSCIDLSDLVLHKSL